MQEPVAVAAVLKLPLRPRLPSVVADGTAAVYVVDAGAG